ncbi:hypothetical protein OIU79_015221 [Salix purpurea]|uniref:Uncharacterized protein n=1 Tax=Salix purpurea TaxID=77065 RepID=A0A9Q0PBR6_SALPP|nr:hypothetical protein OIU79_015221 [Salix purpurea]
MSFQSRGPRMLNRLRNSPAHLVGDSPVMRSMSCAPWHWR